jgi:hypothetical protein
VNTAQDVVDYLLASVGGGAQDGEHRAVRQAVVHGVREVIQCKDWLWHTKTNQFLSSNVTTTATEITQGQSLVTVSDASKMVVGRIFTVGGYFDEPCRILEVSGNVLTTSLPAKQTLPAGETPTLTMQTFYDLPEELKDIDTLVTHTVGTLHCYLTPQDWHRLEINTRGSGEPYYYTIMRSDTAPNCYQIRFVGIPTDGTVIHYTYRYRPKEIKWMGYENATRQGTVTVQPDLVTVTGNDTDFPSDIVGSVIRFGTSSDEPEPIGSLFPFVRERVIKQRNDSDSLTVSEDLAVRAGVKYCITDAIDASPTMYTAILSACEMWYARIAGKPYDNAMAAYNRDLRIAMENDQIAPLSGRPHTTPYPTPRTMGWHSSLRQDLA